MKNNTKKSGFIKYIIIFIILILILSYFNIDIRGIIESPSTQKNISYVIELWNVVWQKFLKPLWDNYLSEPLLYFWQNIFIDILWKAFVQGFEAIKSGNFNAQVENILPQLFNR